MRNAIAQIDSLYRSHRGVDTNQVVHHGVEYRVGRLRSQAAIMHTMTGNILPFSWPGLAHFDGFLGEDEEAIALNFRGTATQYFTGPVRKFGSDPFFTGALSRLLVPISTVVPANHAILFDRKTLHLQSPQLHIPWKPGVYLRSIVSIHEESA